MSQAVQIRGARAHNLQGVDLELPLGGLVVFCGPSGSGKSSMALHVLHRAGQARALQLLTAAQRERIGRGAPPAVDLVRHLPPTLAVTAEARPPSGVSVAGHGTLHARLASLFAEAGTVHDPETGQPLRQWRAAEVVDELTALPEGSRLTVLAPLPRRPDSPVRRVLEEALGLGFGRARVDGAMVRLDELDAGEADDLDRAEHIELVVDRIRRRPDIGQRLEDAIRTAWAAGAGRARVLVRAPGAEEHLLGFGDHPWDPDGERSLPRPELDELLGVRAGCSDCGQRPGEAPATCPTCTGSGLPPEARRLRLGGRCLPELLGGRAAAVIPWLEGLPAALREGPLGRALAVELGALWRLGLAGLRLAQPVTTLALGEWSRLQLAQVLASEPEGLLVVVDEPGLGLGPRDLPALGEALRDLVRGGCSVLLVAHRPELVRLADHIVEFGPGAGHLGGRVVYQGDLEGLSLAGTATARVLSGGVTAPPPLPLPPSAPRWRLGGVRLDHRELPELSGPRGGLTVVTGSSGSGRRSLVLRALAELARGALELQGEPPLPHEVFEGLDDIRRLLVLDRRPLGRSRRSTVATAAGLWDPLRRILAQTREARIRGLGPGTFSFNASGGRCERCEGLGEIVVLVPGQGEQALRCPHCLGRRFAPSTEGVRFRGLSAGDLLETTVSELLQVVEGHPTLLAGLAALEGVGLGYLPLGRSSWSLSGGEGQRVRLAAELARVRALRPGRRQGPPLGELLVLLDPTAGLHRADAGRVLTVLQELGSRGATLVAVVDEPWVAEAAHARLELPDPLA